MKKCIVLSAALSAIIFLASPAFSADSETDSQVFIGARRDISGSGGVTPPLLPQPAATSRAQREWFKPGLNDSAFFDAAFSAAKMLAYDKLDPADRAAIQAALEREKIRAGIAFLWLLDWTKCGDASARLGAVAGLSYSSAEPKKLGASLATSAMFDPDERVRKASAASIKSAQDKIAERAILDTWKSSFDESGILDANEARRKASVNAMREINEKQIFQALLYYATLELRAGSAALVGVDTVSIKGNNINLPIDLPKLDLINVEGAIAVPAMASLKQATGQDFGRNLLKWNEWLNKLP